MVRKPSPPSIAPLQRVVAEPVTDADEQAALDALHDQPAETAARGHTPGESEEAQPATAADGLRLFLQLSGKERLLLMTEQAARLPPLQRFALLERLVAELPPDMVQNLEPVLRTRLGAGD